MTLGAGGLATMSGTVGCASSGPPAAASAKQALAAVPAAVSAVPAMMPAEVARGSLVSSVTVSHFGRSLEVASKLGGLVSPLPLDPNNLTAMLAQQLGVGPEVVAKLDVNRSAVAVALGNGAGKDASWVLALPARSAADAAALPALLGVEEEKRGPVVRLKPATTPALWAMPSASNLILASDVEALGRGTLLSLQMAATSSATEDVTVVVWPAAMAKEKGVELRFALRMMVEQMATAMAEQGTALKAEQRALFDQWVEDLGDAERLEIGGRLDEARGVSLQLRFVPLVGSKLEAKTKETHPVTLDPLVRTGPTGMAMAIGDISMFRGIYLASAERLKAEGAKNKSAAEAAKLIEVGLGAMTGANSVAGSFRGTPYLLSTFGLKDAAAASALETALLGASRDTLAAYAASMDPVWAAVAPSLTAKKETLGKTKALHLTVSMKAPKNATPKIKNVLETFRGFYGDKPQFWLAIKDQKLLMAAGDASVRATFARVLAGEVSPKPNPGLDEALAAEKGHGLVYYADLYDVLGILPHFKNLGAKPDKLNALMKVVSLPLPVYGSAWGEPSGRLVTWDLVIPRGFLENLGKTLPALVALFNQR